MKKKQNKVVTALFVRYSETSLFFTYLVVHAFYVFKDGIGLFWHNNQKNCFSKFVEGFLVVWKSFRNLTGSSVFFFEVRFVFISQNIVCVVQKIKENVSFAFTRKYLHLYLNAHKNVLKVKENLFYLLGSGLFCLRGPVEKARKKEWRKPLANTGFLCIFSTILS